MLNRQGVYVYNYIYLYMYTCFCTVTTSKYTYVYVYLNIRTWILDYLREGFPWPARPFNLNIRKPVYLNIHSNIIYGWIWRFVLPPGPCGPPSTYLNVVTVYIHIYILYLYIYIIYIYMMLLGIWFWYKVARCHPANPWGGAHLALKLGLELCPRGPSFHSPFLPTCRGWGRVKW